MLPPRRALLRLFLFAGWFSALLVSSALRAAPAPSPPPPPSAAAGVEETAAEAYQRHLDQGVQLWREQRYREAIPEFEAAYRAEPKASPLVNVALCRRALSEYPEAVEALHKALDQHGESLEPKVREAAEREVRDLEALIGSVTVRTEPAGALLRVDGAERGRAGEVGAIALSPGPHDIEARLAGYGPVKITLEVVAGQHRRDLVIKLEPSEGQVRIIPRESAAFVEVDGQSPVQAGWEGALHPGVHQVRVFVPDGASVTAQIRVAAGESVVVTQQEDGSLSSPAVLASTSAEAPAAELDEAPRTGFFLHGNGALLFIGATAPDGITAKSGGGVGLGLRIGYRVADWAAIEAGGQLSSVGGTGELRVADASLAGYDAALGYAAFSNARYTLQSMRLGAMLRLLAPGRSVVRFVAAAGGGVVGEDLSWTLADSVAPDGSLAADAAHPIGVRPSEASGWNGYGELDLGVELEFSNVFFGLTVQHILQGTNGLTGTFANGAAYVPYPGPLFLIGPALHVGYGFW